MIAFNGIFIQKSILVNMQMVPYAILYKVMLAIINLQLL